MTNVFEICDIPKSVDIKTLKYKMINYLNLRKNTNIEAGYSEDFIADSSYGINISSGNEGMDVKTINNEGIDVCCLSLNGNKNWTNEKSVIQNFKKSGNNLDNFFSNNNHNEALELYKNDFKDKLICIKKKYSMTKLYYIVFISTKNKVYALCLEINIDSISNIISNGFTKTQKSINIRGFIDDIYGNTKLYKAKKRIEIRFRRKVLNHPKIVEIYSVNETPKEKIQYLLIKYNLSELKKEMEEEGISIGDLFL